MKRVVGVQGLDKEYILNVEMFSCPRLRNLEARFIFNMVENGGLLSGETGPREGTYTVPQAPLGFP